MLFRSSEFCRGQYKGDAATLAQKAIHYINTKAMQRRSKNRVPDFVETTAARRIFTAIRHAEAFSTGYEGKACIVIGDSGHGKSKCLQQYAQMTRNTLYLLLDDTVSSKALFVAIAQQMNTVGRAKINIGASLQVIIQQLIEALEHRMMLIILDEASGLGVRQINQLRQVLMVRAKRPLILAGNNQLLHTISQDVTRCGNESLDQFRSRLLSVVNLDDLAAGGDTDGGDRLYTDEDIRSLYEQLGVKLSREAVLTLKKICQSPQSGRLRTCEHIMSAICTSPLVKAGQTVDADYIFAAIEQLGLPIKDQLPFTFTDIAVETRRQDKAEMA